MPSKSQETIPLKQNQTKKNVFFLSSRDTPFAPPNSGKLIMAWHAKRQGAVMKSQSLE
jgi:hypothetical protein